MAGSGSRGAERRERAASDAGAFGQAGNAGAVDQAGDAGAVDRVAGLDHAHVLSAELPDGRPKSASVAKRRMILIGAGIAMFALTPIVMFALLSLPQRFGFTLGRGGGVAAAIASIVLMVIVVCVPALVWALLAIRSNAVRWREARDAIASGGNGDVADALAKVCGESGPNSSWMPWFTRIHTRWPAGTLPAPMTIVSRRLVPEISAISPVPGLLEPEPVVQTLGRGHRSRRVILGVCGALMLAGVAIQVPTLSARGWLSTVGVLPMAGFGLFFLTNALFGSKLSRWRADRAGPADAPFWCGPGWVRWHYGRGKRLTWHRHDSVMVVLAVGNPGPIQWREVRVFIAGPEGTFRFGFDGIDAEFARLWRAWTATSARHPDAGTPMLVASAGGPMPNTPDTR
jgi:hypothetical protein